MRMRMGSRCSCVSCIIISTVVFGRGGWAWAVATRGTASYELRITSLRIPRLLLAFFVGLLAVAASPRHAVHCVPARRPWHRRARAARLRAPETFVTRTRQRRRPKHLMPEVFGAGDRWRSGRRRRTRGCVSFRREHPQLLKYPL